MAVISSIAQPFPPGLWGLAGITTLGLPAVVNLVVVVLFDIIGMRVVVLQGVVRRVVRRVVVLLVVWEIPGRLVVRIPVPGFLRLVNAHTAFLFEMKFF